MSPEDRSLNGRTRRERAGSSKHRGRRGRKHLVETWPSYLLTLLPSERQSLSASAAAQNVSIADVARGILCAAYGLHCPPKSNGYHAGKDTGRLNILLRMPPKLWRCIEDEQTRLNETKRAIILDKIEAYYRRESDGKATD
jgi:hypothetical protein